MMRSIVVRVVVAGALGQVACESVRQAGVSDRYAGVVYIWSPLMPLSRAGIREIEVATRQLGIPLTIIAGSELAPAGTAHGATGGRSFAKHSLGAEFVAAGATLHFPAILVHRNSRIAGSAILGYKTADTYRMMIANRLRTTRRSSPAIVARPASARVRIVGQSGEAPWWRDFRVSGRPGPYFRFVPGRNALAFEEGQSIYLLDLEDGRTGRAPGFVDFVPSPDGRLFVTPGGRRTGLAFYDAAAVFRAAERGSGQNVEPIYNDGAMRDQYPSIGILSAGRVSTGSRTVYRVLTSWYDRVVFRDYVVIEDGSAGRGLRVQPVGERVAACPDHQVSIPIIAPDGRELAGRDEVAAVTKIFRLYDDGRCDEALDLGVQTGKVSWNPDGRRLAFAIPRGVVRDGTGIVWSARDDNPGLAGIWVFDRRDLTMQRVPGSEEAIRLAFPEFAGRDSIAFLLAAESNDNSRFRLVCCMR